MDTECSEGRKQLSFPREELYNVTRISRKLLLSLPHMTFGYLHRW